MVALPESIEVVVEVPRFGFVKRRANGEVDFVSPLPCPVNYGSIPSRMAADGDPLDVVVLGRRLPRGARTTLPVRGVIAFVDAGVVDHKVVCSPTPLTRADRAFLLVFFAVYARAKGLLNRDRRLPGPTRCDGFVD